MSSTTYTSEKKVKIFVTPLDEYTQEVRVYFYLDEKDFLYKDFISFDVSHPSVDIAPYKTHNQALLHYDHSFKGTKEILKHTVIISTIISSKILIIEPVYLYCTYFQRSAHKMNYIMHKINFVKNTSNNTCEHAYMHVSLNKQQKHSQSHTIPFNVHVTHLFLQFINKASSFSLALFMRYIFLLSFLCAGIFLFFFVKNKGDLQTTLKQDAQVIIVTVYLIMISSLIYHLQNALSFFIVDAFMTCMCCFSGIYYTIKSTHSTLQYLRAFCSLCGGMFITVTVPLIFKLLQYMSMYMR